MKIELVKPQGYCAGVLNAIKTAIKAKEENKNRNIFVLGMLVHNKEVIAELTKKGITTLEVESDGPLPSILKSGDVVIFTAHGHNEHLEKLAKEKGLIIYDATCPIVKKNLDLIKQEINEDHQIIYIGQKNHKETQAALSISPEVSLYDTKEGINYNLITDASPLVVNQTTLNFLSLNDIHNEIKEHFPSARIQNEICAATRLRQESILNISKDSDLIVIIGDRSSSNSQKLLEIAKSTFNHSFAILVENLDDIKSLDLKMYKKATIASGASTPISVVEQITNYLLNY